MRNCYDNFDFDCLTQLHLLRCFLQSIIHSHAYKAFILIVDCIEVETVQSEWRPTKSIQPSPPFIVILSNCLAVKTINKKATTTITKSKSSIFEVVFSHFTCYCLKNKMAAGRQPLFLTFIQICEFKLFTAYLLLQIIIQILFNFLHLECFLPMSHSIIKTILLSKY